MEQRPIHVLMEGHHATSLLKKGGQPGWQTAGVGFIGENARRRSRSMGTHRKGGFWALLIALVVGLGMAAPVNAYDNPDLLPDHPTPVIDLAKAFSDKQRASLEDSLNSFEAETGWKLRVLTQYERTPDWRCVNSGGWTKAACCW